MAREDFKEKIEELNAIGIVRVCTDFYHVPNSRLFVKSPITSDKNWSMKLYPKSNSFCDFANGNKSGDIIGFYSYVSGLNNWESLKQLQAFYGLKAYRQQDAEERRRKIQLQQEQERKKTERKQAFHRALFDEIGVLKEQARKYRVVLKNPEIKPFSDLWTYCMSEAQRAEYHLDVLTAADMGTYRRMKSNPDLGLSSDRPQWLLDVLDILEERGVFHATQEEITEITAQRNFELCRMPGQDRGYCLE